MINFLKAVLSKSSKAIDLNTSVNTGIFNQDSNVLTSEDDEILITETNFNKLRY